MIVEVKGVRTLQNAGAELMLRAAEQEVRTWKGSHLVVKWPSIDAGRLVSELRLGHKLWIPRLGSAGGLPVPLATYLPTAIRRRFRLASEQEVDAVLDASGYAYFGRKNILKMARLVRRIRKRGQKLILLPQAFGPFRGDDIKAAMLEILQEASLVFPRDRTSADHLRSLVGNGASLEIYPDFTLAVAARETNAALPSRFACIIPNRRMIRDTSDEVSARYMTFLAEAIRSFSERGLRCVVLVHDRDDLEISQQLVTLSGSITQGDVRVPTDPLEAKAIIGRSVAVLGSRYHAIISALTQGVPTIGTSWSHKYEELFDEFGCEGLLLRPDADPRMVQDAVERVTSEESAVISSQLRRVAAQQAARTEDMWSKVRAVLGVERR